MEAEDEQDLGAAAPAEKGCDKYLEEQKNKREGENTCKRQRGKEKKERGKNST